VLDFVSQLVLVEHFSFDKRLVISIVESSEISNVGIHPASHVSILNYTFNFRLDYRYGVVLITSVHPSSPSQI